jgi:hypothetical protein
MQAVQGTPPTPQTVPLPAPVPTRSPERQSRQTSRTQSYRVGKPKKGKQTQKAKNSTSRSEGSGLTRAERRYQKQGNWYQKKWGSKKGNQDEEEDEEVKEPVKKAVAGEKANKMALIEEREADLQGAEAQERREEQLETPFAHPGNDRAQNTGRNTANWEQVEQEPQTPQPHQRMMSAPPAQSIFARPRQASDGVIFGAQGLAVSDQPAPSADEDIWSRPECRQQ